MAHSENLESEVGTQVGQVSASGLLLWSNQPTWEEIPALRRNRSERLLHSRIRQKLQDHEEHKSEDTPGWIGWGTVLYQWGKVYMYGSRHNWDYWDVKVFNGFKWDDLGDKQEKL